MRRVIASAVFLASLSFASQPVRSRHAMVVTREAHATELGDAVLAAGGNAVDAAVGVALMLAVTHPSAGNLGGGGFMLIRLADGKSTFLDFRERAPAAASRDMYLDANGDVTKDSTIGYRACGVPGTVRGLAYALKKYGTKRWFDLITPAIDRASLGVPISWQLAQLLRSKAISEKLGKFKESKAVYLNDGAYYEAGDTLVQADLAWTLQRLKENGPEDFYTGETAKRLVADMQKHDGLITLDDLRDYKVIEREPLTGNYHGYGVITAPPPSSGGVGILQMLGILDGTDYTKTGAGSARSLHFLAETMRRYFADRSEYLGDPDFFTNPLTKLLDPKYIAGRRASIDPSHATPSDKILPGKLDGKESTETTHFSIVDEAGNAVSMTYTLNGSFGSGVTAEGTGILLNNEMDDFAPKPGNKNMFGLIQGEGDAIAPHKTPLSSMTPTILTRDGKLFMVVGSPGGPRIITSVLQTIVNVVDFKMNVQDAVDQPRIHHQWMPDQITFERGISPDTVDLLRSMGHTVAPAKENIGDVAAIVVDDGWLQGAPDPRTGATAKGH